MRKQPNPPAPDRSLKPAPPISPPRVLGEAETRLRNWIADEVMKIDGDDRYHDDPANVQINAPLALIQVDLTSRMRTLKQALAVLMGAEENQSKGGK